jgi:hypothetical protein
MKLSDRSFSLAAPRYLFFQLVNARCEEGAMILQTAASRNGERSSAIPLSQLRFSIGSFTTRRHPDRGSSYRLREHADLLPGSARTESLSSTTPIPPTLKRGRPQRTEAPIYLKANRQSANWGIFRRHF